MQRFRYRLAAALDRARAREVAAAHAVRRACADVAAARDALAQVEAPVAVRACAADFAWSASVTQTSRMRLRHALATRDEAERVFAARRREREALGLHRAQSLAAFEVAAERAAARELEDLNAATGPVTRP